MPNLSRIRTKFGWVRSVANHIRADWLSRQYLLLNGCANLVLDPYGLKLPYKVPIVLNGRKYAWPFRTMLDYGLAYELWVQPSYAILHPYPDDVRHILDIGANNGMSALYFRSHFPFATIHCVEPNDACVNQIRELTHIIDNVNVHQKVVADCDNGKEFFIDPKSSVSSSLIRRSERQEPRCIESISLNSLLGAVDADYVDILKFDIEGSESLVFSDDVDLGRIKTVIGELHYDLCDVGGIKRKFAECYEHVFEVELAQNRTLILATTEQGIQFKSID